MVIALLALLVVVLPLTVVSALAWGGQRTSAALRWAALAVSGIAAIALFGPGWADSGPSALIMLGLPVVLSGAAVLAGSSRYGAAVTWTAALAQLAWGLLLGLGIGLLLLPAALIEFAAAVAQTVPAQRSRA
jgi:hypothetical protein